VAGGIRFFDRVLVLGQTQSGKSELLNYLAASIRVQRLVIDTKDELVIPGVEPVTSPAAIDWRAPLIHFRGGVGDRDTFQELFDAANRRRNLTVVVHELADLCDYNAHRTPPAVSRYLSQGAAWGRGLLAASQRPVEMPKRARTDVDHVFVMVPPGLDAADVKTTAELMRLPVPELDRLLGELERDFGRYSFLWFERGAGGKLTRCPPLPAAHRRRTIARRRTPNRGVT
jgi:energy-coupling factor transporter ATP-binding protein EcfA2